MQQLDEIHTTSEQLSMEEEEGISTPMTAQILEFCDDDVGGDLFPPPDQLNPIALLPPADDVFSSSSPTAAAVNTGAPASSPLPCYADDSPFCPFPSLDAATLSALLDVPPAQLPNLEADLLPATVGYPSSASSSSLNPPLAMFPAPTPYAGDGHLDPFDDQISMGDAATSGYRPYSPDLAAVPIAAAARRPTGRQQQRAVASEDEYYAAAAVARMQQPPAFAGMQAPPPCALLEGGGVGPLYYGGGMARSEGPHGYFYAGAMMAAGPDAGFVAPADVAEYQRMEGGLGLYGQEAPPQRAYSAGDLQVHGGGGQHLMAGTSGNPTPVSASDISAMDDSTFKVGRLSVEERKEKIHRYMKKRNERNFSKKIKYACRKTLADSRPRVRGRFARNDEFGEITKPRSSNHEFDDEDEVAVKVEEDILDSSDILAHISGVNSFKYNFTLESWI